MLGANIWVIEDLAVTCFITHGSDLQKRGTTDVLVINPILLILPCDFLSFSTFWSSHNSHSLATFA